MRALASLAALLLLGCAGAGNERSSVPVVERELPDASPYFNVTLPASPHGSDAGAPEPAVTRPGLNDAAPDPEPLASARQFEYELVYDHGAVRIRHVGVRLFERPVVTARRVGRYAIELWIGRELVDRVRFDFPIIGSEPVPTGSRRSLDAPPSLLPGAVATRRVLVPASERPTRAVLVDRATGEQWPLPWPPDAPLAPAAPSLLPRAPGTTAPAPASSARDATEPPPSQPAPAAPDAGAPSAAGPDGGAD